MNDNDRRLGMNLDISRRDFMNGVALAAGSLALPSPLLAFAGSYEVGKNHPLLP